MYNTMKKWAHQYSWTLSCAHYQALEWRIPPENNRRNSRAKYAQWYFHWRRYERHQRENARKGRNTEIHKAIPNTKTANSKETNTADASVWWVAVVFSEDSPVVSVAQQFCDDAISVCSGSCPLSSVWPIMPIPTPTHDHRRTKNRRNATICLREKTI